MTNNRIQSIEDPGQIAANLHISKQALGNIQRRIKIFVFSWQHCARARTCVDRISFHFLLICLLRTLLIVCKNFIFKTNKYFGTFLLQQLTRLPTKQAILWMSPFMISGNILWKYCLIIMKVVLLSEGGEHVSSMRQEALVFK